MGTSNGKSTCSMTLTTCWVLLIGLGIMLSPVHGWVMTGGAGGAGLRLFSSGIMPRLSPTIATTPLSSTQLQASSSQDASIGTRSKPFSHILHFAKQETSFASSSLALMEEDDMQWQPPTTKMLSNSFQSSMIMGQRLGSSSATASSGASKLHMSSLLHFNQSPDYSSTNNSVDSSSTSSSNVRQRVDQLLQEADEVLEMANAAMGEAHQSLQNASQTAARPPPPAYERRPLSPLLHFRNQLDTSGTGATSLTTTTSTPSPSTHTELPKGPAVTLAEQVAARLHANQQAKQMADDLAKMQQQVDLQRAESAAHQQQMEQAKAQELADQQATQQQQVLEEQQVAEEQAKRQAEQAIAEQVAQVKATPTPATTTTTEEEDSESEPPPPPPSEEPATSTTTAASSDDLPTEIEAQREARHAEFEKEKATMDAEFEDKEVAVHQEKENEKEQEPVPTPVPPPPQTVASEHNIAAMVEKSRVDALDQRMQDELERWKQEEDGTIASELVGVMTDGSSSSSDEEEDEEEMAQEDGEVNNKPQEVEIVDGVAQFNDTALRHAEMDKRIEAELEQWKEEDAAATAAAVEEAMTEDHLLKGKEGEDPESLPMTQQEAEEAEAVAEAIAAKYNASPEDWDDSDVPSLSSVIGEAMEEIKASDVLDEEEGMRQAMEWFEDSVGGKIHGLEDDLGSDGDDATAAQDSKRTQAEKEQATLDTLETMMSAARQAAESLEEDLKKLEASGVNLKDPSQPKRKKKTRKSSTSTTTSSDFKDPLESMTVAKLRDELRKRGLKVSGKKAELVGRLREAQFTEDDS